jgi:alpha-N-arabinofuranosidase
VFLAASSAAVAGLFGGKAVNTPQGYPRVPFPRTLDCHVDAAAALGSVDPRIFGTNLEWFNNAGGLATGDLRAYRNLVDLAREEGITVYRFPGGTLADYYNWWDGTGPRARRPVRKHPTDSGQSQNSFGSPEFFQFLSQTGGQGLITVNAGTGTAQQAADWVSYANAPNNAQRRADGFAQPVGIKLWEVGNELYYPSGPGQKSVSVTPDEYAQRFDRFADAMRRADPSITVMAIGVAKTHSGPDTQFPDWTEKLLQQNASKIDMIAVHNAYFPLLYGFGHPHPDVKDAYRALWAAPEAVDRSLTRLDELIHRYEGNRQIGVAITEWGVLFSLPIPIFGDAGWVDHVKTMGSAVYVARVLQVFMSHPRVRVANYFKFTDRSFMGWVNYAGRPKVPYWAFKLYARHSGDQRVQASVDGPTYDVPALGVMDAQNNVQEVTTVATRDSTSGVLYVNFVNRSMTHVFNIKLDLKNFRAAPNGELLSLSAPEPTASEGRDVPDDAGYNAGNEPYSTVSSDSLRIQSQPWAISAPITLPPFSIATLVVRPAGRPGAG